MIILNVFCLQIVSSVTNDRTMHIDFISRFPPPILSQGSVIKTPGLWRNLCRSEYKYLWEHSFARITSHDRCKKPRVQERQPAGIADSEHRANSVHARLLVLGRSRGSQWHPWKGGRFGANESGHQKKAGEEVMGHMIPTERREPRPEGSKISNGVKESGQTCGVHSVL